MVPQSLTKSDMPFCNIAWLMSRPERRDLKKLTGLTALTHVTETLAKLITYNIKLKREKQKNRARNNECNLLSQTKAKGEKTHHNLVLKSDKSFQIFGKIYEFTVIDCCIFIYTNTSSISENQNLIWRVTFNYMLRCLKLRTFHKNSLDTLEFLINTSDSVILANILWISSIRA